MPTGSSRLMIVEAAQINLKDKEQKKIFEQSTHFNPVDLVCGIMNYKGKKFDLEQFIAADQGFITNKSYKGKDHKVQNSPDFGTELWQTGLPCLSKCRSPLSLR